MFNRFFLLVCFLFILVSNCFGIRTKRGLEHLESDEKTKTSSASEVLKDDENKRAGNNLDDIKCSAKANNNNLFDSALIESLSHEHGEKETEKIHGSTGSDEKDKVRVEKSIPHKSLAFEDTSSLKKESVKGVREDALQDVSAKHKDIEELKHPRAQANDASVETKLETKKIFKPDLDIFMYSKMPQLHKVPPFYDLFNTKEELPAYEHLYPFKWLQRRSPIQSAFEIANMMFKVGLDELDSDDYSEQIPFFDTSSKMSYRSERNPEKYFCPLHTLQKPIEGNNAGPKVLQVCSCHLMKKAADNDHEHLSGQKEKDSTGEPTH